MKFWVFPKPFHLSPGQYVRLYNPSSESVASPNVFCEDWGAPGDDKITAPQFNISHEETDNDISLSTRYDNPDSLRYVIHNGGFSYHKIGH